VGSIVVRRVDKVVGGEKCGGRDVGRLLSVVGICGMRDIVHMRGR